MAFPPCRAKTGLDDDEDPISGTSRNKLNKFSTSNRGQEMGSVASILAL